MYRFNTLRVGFHDKSFDYQLSMPVINVINCKRKGLTKAYLVSPFILSKSSTTGNISVFEELNIIQIGMDKVDEN